MPTIHDVAKQAQVSVSTVSLVLNNKGGVAEATGAKVRKIAAELGYEAQNARAKKTQSGSIAFVKAVMHGHVLNQSHQTFIADYIDGLSTAASKLGFKTEVISFHNEKPQSMIEQLQKNKLDGAIVLATEMTPAEVSQFASSPVPTVFMDACYDALPFDFADMNNIGAVSQIVSYLVKCGHEDIGFVQGSFETPNFMARYRAFEQAMKSHGLKLEHIYKIDSVFEVACKDLQDIFSKPQLQAQGQLPSALFCVHDILALASIRTLRDCGYKVPEDVSVIGFDNLQLAALSEPPLTSYEVSKKAIGRKAAELLIGRITQADKAVEKIRIDGCLIKRSSVQHRKP